MNKIFVGVGSVAIVLSVEFLGGSFFSIFADKKPLAPFYKAFASVEKTPQDITEPIYSETLTEYRYVFSEDGIPSIPGKDLVDEYTNSTGKKFLTASSGLLGTPSMLTSPLSFKKADDILKNNIAQSGGNNSNSSNNYSNGQTGVYSGSNFASSNQSSPFSKYYLQATEVEQKQQDQQVTNEKVAQQARLQNINQQIDYQKGIIDARTQAYDSYKANTNAVIGYVNSAQIVDVDPNLLDRVSKIVYVEAPNGNYNEKVAIVNTLQYRAKKDSLTLDALVAGQFSDVISQYGTGKAPTTDFSKPVVDALKGFSVISNAYYYSKETGDSLPYYLKNKTYLTKYGDHSFYTQY